MRWVDNQDYRLTCAGEIPSPALVYYQEILAANLSRALAIAGGASRLWPHMKTHKMPDMIRMQRKAGINRFKCATIAECEMCAGEGAGHILMAYPLVGPNVGRFLTLTERFPETAFYALGDDISRMEALSSAALARGLHVNAMIDVDMGMGRTGVPLDEVKDFYARCQALKGVKIVGLHCYDGHINQSDLRERTEKALPAQKKAVALKAELGLPILILGGTPSFPCHAVVQEAFLSPGTIFVSDAGEYQNYPDLGVKPAAAVLARVISHPAKDRFTIDLGYKGIASDPAGARGMIAGHPETAPLFQSEEHWVFTTTGRRPEIGEVLYVIPNHVCPTSALYPEALIARGGEIVGSWPVTARVRRLTI